MTYPIGPGSAAGTATGALLQSVVEVARAIFGAAASSIFLLDEAADELVFEAVAGEGEGFLVGTRIPAHRGIAGWAVDSGQSVIADSLAENTTFARDLAESTHYVPQALMAAPLLSTEGVLGVLEVMDPGQQSRSNLSDLDLLALFANQAAIALQVAGACPNCRQPRESVADGDELLDAFKDFLRQRAG